MSNRPASCCSHNHIEAVSTAFLLIMLSMVTMLNSVPLPLTKAFCNSAGVIVPDLFASTLREFILSNVKLVWEWDFLPLKVASELGFCGHVWRRRGWPARLELRHPDQIWTSLLSKRLELWSFVLMTKWSALYHSGFRELQLPTDVLQP